MKPTLLIVGSAVAMLAAVSAMRAIRKPELAAVLQFLGSVLLAVMVLAHIAEALSLLPQMGWGRPGTPGHYLDLVSAVSGLVLLVSGVSMRAFGIGRKAIWFF
ncbi:MAG: hypothetical protein ACYDAE_06820 [Steroidobacteraceae bacterium]